MAQNVIAEISPLSEKDCLYIADRHKQEFTYPIHTHEVCELNFIHNGQGVRRIVGDSIEYIGNLELVLLTSPLEHAWEQGTCTNKDVREITIQFSSDILPKRLLERNQFSSIATMLQRAENGLSFSEETILRVYGLLVNISNNEDHFEKFLQFISLLHLLSSDTHARVLSSGAFAQKTPISDSRRVRKVKEYIEQHYFEEIRLAEIADMVGMSPVGFSRFFKLRTGKTLSDYLTNIRLGHASRMLVDTTHSIAEIAYQCGFNNLSNFNRLFLKYKQITPTAFKNTYQKNKIIL
ncbi:MAG: helix-turn-helix domain-containing protein [Bacteroidales bacterium]|nr:helix-turn-helix domain-containing protein [Bacteroidales bacterium]